MSTQPVEPTQALAWEDRHRRTATAGAAVAAVAILAGVLLQGAAMNGYPHVPLLSALQHATTIGRTDLRVAQVQFLNDRASGLLFSSILLGAGYATATLGLGYLYRAARARWARAPRWGLIVLLIGLALIAIGPALSQVALTIDAHSFVTGTARGHDAVENVYGSVQGGGQLAGYVGSLFTALGLIILSLNAMRAGLLTKGVGTFGVINGAVFVVFLLSPAKNLLLVAWLLAVAALISGRWPGGALPAWTTGEPRPWPSAQELRAQREAQIATRRGGRDRGASNGGGDDDRPQATLTGAPNPSTGKRKRKRK